MITCSDELKVILGLDAATPPSFEVFEGCIHPDDRLVEAMLTAALDGTPDVEYAHRVVRPDGTVRWVAGVADPFDGPELARRLRDVARYHRPQFKLDLLDQAKPRTR